ncbi:MAG: hypothetical protein JO091_08825 [Acidobacteriaceae bacterium]|nr:hypothetical protein [Acidobacteriaceae bacterium]
MSTTALILVPVILCTVSLLAVAPLIARLCSRSKIEEITPEWLENFTPSSYYPMQGLLADEDFHFLSRQPGFDFSLYRKLRSDRLHIFRHYLHRLIADFNRLHAAARVMVARGREDRSHLVMRLIMLKMQFSFAVLQAHVSYLLCSIGIGSLAAQAAIRRLEQMSTELGSISAIQLA